MATTFVWEGKTSTGERRRGEIDAENVRDASAELRRRRIRVSSMKPKPTTTLSGFKFGQSRRVKTRDLAVFTRQFATMVDAGLPLVQCLTTQAKQVSSPALRRALTQVTQDVESGSTLADALAKQKASFGDLYVHMVEAGEAGGILDDILARLATYLEKADALKRKVKAALTYPSVVMFVAISATVFMLLFIIPIFAKLFADFGATLPLPTRVVLGMSDFLRSKWWVLGGGGVLGVIVLKRYYATKSGRLNIDRFVLKVPVLGDVLLKSAIARSTRTLGTLVSSGVPILEGLDVTAKTSGNQVLHNALQATKVSISEGETIAEPLRQSAVFPPMVVQMISVGEETGALDNMLTKVADFYEEEVDTAVESLTSIIEPIMVVFMGGMVGGMVVAMYLPIFKLINVMIGG